MENHIYLIPTGDRAYKACIAATAPSPSAIFMVAEGTYPAELWWSRHDLNLCRQWCSEVCQNREALITLLDELGSCGHNVETLWDYEDSTSTNDALTQLFDDCYERKRETITAAFDKAMEELERRGGEDPLLVIGIPTEG